MDSPQKCSSFSEYFHCALTDLQKEKGPSVGLKEEYLLIKLRELKKKEKSLLNELKNECGEASVEEYKRFISNMYNDLSDSEETSEKEEQL